MPAYAENLGTRDLATGAGLLKVSVDISHSEISKATIFTVTFVNPTTGEIEPHVDYDLMILKDGKQIFRASEYLNRPVGLLHGVSGVEKHTYKFEEEGSYTARVTVFGFSMVWFEPANADFSVTLTPEFQSMLPAMILASLVLIAAVVLARFRTLLLHA